MGLNFRQSIKIGKNTRINISRTGGIGLSTGVKGARVSVNQKGIRTSVGRGGLRYTKSHSFNQKETEVNYKDKQLLTKKEFNEKQLPYILAGILLTILSFFFPPLFFSVLIVFAKYLIFFFRNRKIRKE